MDKKQRAKELYVSWINGNRDFVMNEIATSDAKMVMMAEITLMFQENSICDLRQFLKHISKYA